MNTQKIHLGEHLFSRCLWYKRRSWTVGVYRYLNTSIFRCSMHRKKVCDASSMHRRYSFFSFFFFLLFFIFFSSFFLLFYSVLFFFPFFLLYFLYFLDVSSHLFKRVCQSVGPPVRPSVGPSTSPTIGPSVTPSWNNDERVINVCV